MRSDLRPGLISALPLLAGYAVFGTAAPVPGTRVRDTREDERTAMLDALFGELEHMRQRTPLLAPSTGMPAGGDGVAASRVRLQAAPHKEAADMAKMVSEILSRTVAENGRFECRFDGDTLVMEYDAFRIPYESAVDGRLTTISTSRTRALRTDAREASSPTRPLAHPPPRPPRRAAAAPPRGRFRAAPSGIASPKPHRHAPISATRHARGYVTRT